MFLVHIAQHTYQHPQHIHLSLGLNYYVAHLVYYVGLKSSYLNSPYTSRPNKTITHLQNNIVLYTLIIVLVRTLRMYNVHTYIYM